MSGYFLNPEFVGMFEVNHAVYLFFREEALERRNETTAGKKPVIYSRVARVCAHDSGGKRYGLKWTTFLKARLLCAALDGGFAHFDELQGVDFLRKKSTFVASFSHAE